MSQRRVVIIGAGFGGLLVAKQLKNADLSLTIIDRTNHHLFQPLLYQVATSALSPRDIAIPIREILKRQRNATVLMDEVTRILPQERALLLLSGKRLEYDTLVIATGMRHSYFGHHEWERYAPGLKTLEDAIHLRRMILRAFEDGETRDDPALIEALLTFVIIGGGPTGVELAGAIGEIAHQTLRENFRRIDPSKTKIYLVEAGPRILPSYTPGLSLTAERDLHHMGIHVLTNSTVQMIDETGVTTQHGKIRTKNLIWAAGNEASPLLSSLGTPLDRYNRLIVDEYLSLKEYPEIFVVGDAAHIEDGSGKALPGVAPVATQSGKFVGNLIAKGTLRDGKPFIYHDKGSMATIGRARAVALIGKREYRGFIAWLLWSLIHVAFLIGFRNRFAVMVEWCFWHVTGKRSSRLIYEAVKAKDFFTPKTMKNSSKSTKLKEVSPRDG